jgi:uncharacterized membrane protein YhhN
MTVALGDLAGWMLLLGCGCAVVNWVAVVRRLKRLEYIFKPATLVAFALGAWLLGQRVGDGRMALWFVAALVFSLAGDIFLMLPGERWFVPGLLAFLVGHVCYIIGFNPTWPPVGAIIIVVVVSAVDWAVLPKIVRAVRHSDAPQLQGPVIGYGVILSLMLVSAWGTWLRPSWGTTGRLLASLGGTLFFASDLMLAWNKFVRSSRLLHVAVIVTYHLGQLALALTVGSRLP